MIARFKAKGDGALVYDDLGNRAYYDEDEVLDSIIALMVECGLPLPPGDKMTAQSTMFSKGQWDIQNITVGELKQAFMMAKWPDAWTYRKNTWWDHLRDIALMPLGPIIAVAVVAFLPFWLCGLAASWVFRRLSRKPA